MKHILFIIIRIDNNGTLKLSRNPELHNRTKHINMRYYFLRERVIEVKDLYSKRVDTTENITDIFTKALGPKKFKYFMEKMGLVNIKEISLKADGPGEDDSGSED